MAFITKYLRVDEKRVVQMEIHPVETQFSGNYGKKTRRWLQKAHMQEIRSLLKDAIVYQMSSSVKNKETNTKTSTNTAQIITGSSVRLGYVFKKKSDQHTLLLPDSDSDTDSETGMKYYTVFGQKIIVYACLIQPGSPRGISKLLKVLGDNGSQRKSISSISNYFTRGVTSSPKSTSHSDNSQMDSSRSGSSRTSCQSSEGSQSTSGDSQEHTEIVETVIPSAPSSDGKRTALKGLIKRNNEALKKKRKKKKDSNMKETNSMELTDDDAPTSKRKEKKTILDSVDAKSFNSRSKNQLYSKSEATHSHLTNDKENVDFEPVCSNHDNRLTGSPEGTSSLRRSYVDSESRSPGPSISSNLIECDSNSRTSYEILYFENEASSGSPFRSSVSLSSSKTSSCGVTSPSRSPSYTSSCNVSPRSSVNMDVRSTVCANIDNKNDKFCDNDSCDTIPFSVPHKLVNVSGEMNPELSDSFPRITLCNVPSDHSVTNSTVTPSNSDTGSVTIISADQMDDIGIHVRNDSSLVTMAMLRKGDNLYGCDYTDESVLPCVSFLQRKETVSSNIDKESKISAKNKNNFQNEQNEKSEENLKDGKKGAILSPLFSRTKSQKLKNSDQCPEKEKLEKNMNTGDIYEFDDDLQSTDESMPSLQGGKSRRPKRVYKCVSPSESDVESDELPKLRKLDKTETRIENIELPKFIKPVKPGKSNVESEKIFKFKKVCSSELDRSDFSDKNFELPKLRKPTRSVKEKEELHKSREVHRSDLSDKNEGFPKFKKMVRLESSVKKEELRKPGRPVKGNNETSQISACKTAAVDKENVSFEEKPLPPLFKRRLSQLNLIDEHGHILVGDPNENKDELDCVLIEQLSEMPKVKNEETEDIKRDIRSLQKVSELNEKQLKYLILNSVGYLKGIFEGKVSCRRHEDYKKGGKSRQLLNYDVHLGLYTEEQEDTVMTTLMSIFCKKHHKYLDYLMKVLLPEMLIKIYMEVHGTSHEETEDLMNEAVSTPGAIFH